MSEQFSIGQVVIGLDAGRSGWLEYPQDPNMHRGISSKDLLARAIEHEIQSGPSEHQIDVDAFVTGGWSLAGDEYLYENLTSSETLSGDFDRMHFCNACLAAFREACTSLPKSALALETTGDSTLLFGLQVADNIDLKLVPDGPSGRKPHAFVYLDLVSKNDSQREATRCLVAHLAESKYALPASSVHVFSSSDSQVRISSQFRPSVASELAMHATQLSFASQLWMRKVG